MRALDKHRIANRHHEDDFEIFGEAVAEDDEIEIFGEEAKEPGKLDKIVAAASTLAQVAPELRQGVERTIDPSKARQQQQQYQQLPPSYYQQYQQPQKKGGIPDWAVYSLGAVGVLGLGVVGYKMIKR